MIIDIVLWLLMLIGSTLIHEAGHIVVARSLGVTSIRVSVARLGIIPVLRVHLGEFGARPRTQQIGVIVAGSAAQLLLGSAALAIAWAGWDPLAGAARHLGQISLTLAAVNLLPVVPLDGYWLAILVWGPAAGTARVLNRVSPVARWLLYVACGLGVGALLIRAVGTGLRVP